MTTLFFLSCVLFVMYELNVLINTERTTSLAENLKTDRNFWQSNEVPSETKTRGCLYLLVNLFYLIWTVVGIALASQWQMFILLLSIDVVAAIFSKLLKNRPVERKFFKKFDAILCMVVLLWIFFNHFHPGSLPVINLTF